MYRKAILNRYVSYTPPLKAILDNPVNTDFSALQNYTTLLDAHAYEHLMKEIVLIIRKLTNNTLEDKDYVEQWYKLRFYERFLCEVNCYWENHKGVFKIDGVDPMCVDIPLSDRVTVKEVLPITKVPYSIAISRALTTIRSLNARFCEILEFDYCNKYNIAFDNNYYANIDSVTKSDFKEYQFNGDDGITAACRDAFTFMRVPYTFSAGSLDMKLIEKNIAGKSIDNSKFDKLKILDTKYGNDGILRSPYDVIKDKSFNSIILEGETSKELANEIAVTLKSLTADDYQYLITR
jgi:hypothetical protein